MVFRPRNLWHISSVSLTKVGLIETSRPVVVGVKIAEVQVMDEPICAFSNAKGSPKADHIPSAIANMVLRSAVVPTATMIGSS